MKKAQDLEIIPINRWLKDFFHTRAPLFLAPRECERLYVYFTSRIKNKLLNGIKELPDCKEIELACDIPSGKLTSFKHELQNVIDRMLTEDCKKILHESEFQQSNFQTRKFPQKNRDNFGHAAQFDSKLCSNSFADELKSCMEVNNHSGKFLYTSLIQSGEKFDHKEINRWKNGTAIPKSSMAFEILRRISKFYGFDTNYFEYLLPINFKTVGGLKPSGYNGARYYTVAQHLPNNFNYLDTDRQEEILDWVTNNILGCNTSFARYSKMAVRQNFSVIFPNVRDCLDWSSTAVQTDFLKEASDVVKKTNTRVIAPKHLISEMSSLLIFKTSNFTPDGFQRWDSWCEETARRQIKSISLLFGSLVSSPNATVNGLGVPIESLTFSLLMFPPIWDWYLKWRATRRGFHG